MVECVKKHIITIIAVSLIVIAGIVTAIVLATKSEDEKPHNEFEPLTVILKDNNFIKPNIILNAEFELVKLGNGMIGLLINDPFAIKSHIQMSMGYGYYIDTIPGISHFGEHMVLQGSEKYPPLYPIFNKFWGMKNVDLNAMTYGDHQSYYITLPFNLEYEKAIDILSDAFRYPLYRADIIKNEIQAVNHEFYVGFNSSSMIFDIIEQLSNKNFSFKGNGCGNNETLKVEENELLSKILKGYHMLIKNPKNIFFTLYSNQSINELEDYAKKYLNYEMHVFKDEEIDPEDQQKLEDNIENIKKYEIFDDTIFKHGFFVNTKRELDILYIIYYIGEFDSKELKFDIIDYYNYLFKSKSLLQILNNNSYIAFNVIEVSRMDSIENNNYFILGLFLTEQGLNNINDILTIINKYIELMKKEGAKKEYYNNFVKYMNNKDILKFNKEETINRNNYEKIFSNYYHYDDNKILLTGTFSENNYNEELLQKYLNKLKYEKSFYGVNSKKNIQELPLDNILTNKETLQLNYYKIDFILGTIPDEVGENINNEEYIIENMKLREINPYFSEIYEEKVIPCYKEEINRCEEKNEFDYEKDDEYNHTKLEESNTYMTYYQIDKSSESHLVYSYMKFQLKSFNLDELSLFFLKNYLDLKLSDITEISDTINYNFDNQKKTIQFRFKTFTDNTEKIINKFIDLLNEEPNEDDLDVVKLMVIATLYLQRDINFDNYLDNILEIFWGEREATDNLDVIIENIKGLELDILITLHNTLLNNIKSVQFNIAGNIDESLVRNIHNSIKNNITIITNDILLQQIKQEDESVFVYNYYQKSTFNNPDNGILVDYEVPENLTFYFTIFNACFGNIAMNYLRFNLANAYTPFSSFQNNEFEIYEYGLFKEVDEMEDDINKVLLDIINGDITIENYNEIIESYKLEDKVKKEKNFDNLFNDFISKKDESTNNAVNSELDIPNTFSELVKLIAPVFTEPRRTTILIARKDISDQDFQEMFERRSKNKKYALNEDIEVEHTTNINYLDN